MFPLEAIPFDKVATKFSSLIDGSSIAPTLL
jgi:hypothetical protein